MVVGFTGAASGFWSNNLSSTGALSFLTPRLPPVFAADLRPTIPLRTTAERTGLEGGGTFGEVLPSCGRYKASKPINECPVRYDGEDRTIARAYRLLGDGRGIFLRQSENASVRLAGFAEGDALQQFCCLLLQLLPVQLGCARCVFLLNKTPLR
eukprot:scaffold1926_cov305-Prasinococcus_capsulatus_cf.AAC.4